ncbi:YggT family protein [Haemophilus sputorum]|uniref:YggT family protein n=1 Tax=Haemophilus sputorum TaxID=1078480 RepID=A0ABX9HPF0_9PAST|nr:YggT family protein [Haemophilus sputorum]RDF06550.1 YggT family protein [Haemophilus sputorum]RDF10305.1 YggT family protein [Haemophilus sputorum]
MDTFFIQILTIITGFISFILVLRSWFQFCRVPVHLPISQTLLRMTAPVVDPLTRIIPTVKGINFAAILLTVIVLVIEKLVAYSAPLTLSVFMALLGVLKIFGQILFFTTLIRALMSWVTQGNHPLDYVVAQITEPVLGLIRRILPRTGMLDFSVMVLGFILIFVNQLFYSLFGAVWALA